MAGDLTDILLVVAALGLAALLGAIGGIVFARLAAKRAREGRTARDDANPLHHSSLQSRPGKLQAAATPPAGRRQGGASWGAYAVPRRKKGSGFLAAPVPPPPPPLIPEPEEGEAVDVPMTVTVSFHEAMGQHLPVGPRETTDEPGSILRLPAPEPPDSPPAVRVPQAPEPPTSPSGKIASPSEIPSPEAGTQSPTPVEFDPIPAQAPDPPSLPSAPVVVSFQPPEAEWHDVQACLRIRLQPRGDEPEQPYRTVQIVGIGIENGKRVVLASDGPFCATEAIAIDDIADSIDQETLMRVNDPWNWLKAREWRPDMPLPMPGSPRT